jgi:hypothetical protein
VLFFDGAAWQVQYTQPSPSLISIGGADSAHVIVGGPNGFLLQGVP